MKSHWRQKEYQNSIAEKYRSKDELMLNSDPVVKLLVRTLAKITTSLKPKKVLEIGCGTGRYFHAVKNTLHLTGIDISDQMLIYAKKPARNRQIAAKRISLVNSGLESFSTRDKFDLVYSFGVLGEHAPFNIWAAKKIYSLLKNKGWMIVTTLNPSANKLIYLSQLVKNLARKAGLNINSKFFHVSSFGWINEKEAAKTLKAANFKKIRVRKIGVKYPHLLIFAQKQINMAV